MGLLRLLREGPARPSVEYGGPEWAAVGASGRAVAAWPGRMVAR
ncbi:hypothetical protein APTSU1_000742600 [Apodemus speciosus]|uniref:Uncharacterized protein n=1 Tax=Apodemus speciosus TaxID=105296 RepID=A0ABQ0EYU5_APOSI